MNNKKSISQSNDPVDIENGSIESPGSEEPREFDRLGNSEVLLQTISRLRLVRVPGKGKLDLKEAIAVAFDQGKVFRRWCEKGAPVGEIEVWVEGHKVMSVLPESPAALEAFRFRVPCPDTAVLQLTTQLNGERIVLYNLLLRDVPAINVLRHIETWPNGQSMSLDIKRKTFAVAGAAARGFAAAHSEKTDDFFFIRIAINSYATENATVTGVDRLQTQQDSRTTIDEKDPFSMKKSKTKAAGAGSSFTSRALPVLLLLSLGLAIALIAKTTRLFSKPAEHSAALAPADSVLQPTDPTISTSETVASVNRTGLSMMPTAENGSAAANQPILNANGKKSGEFGQDGKTDLKASDGAVNVRVGTKQSWSDWQAVVYPELAGMKNMYVRMDSKIAERSGLKNLFTQALEASEQFNVVADRDHKKADGVMTLRFERRSPCVGVVFVDVTGRDGKFLWSDYAWGTRETCVPTPKNGQDRMFTEASTTLVDNFENTVKEAQKTTEGKESTTEGG